MYNFTTLGAEGRTGPNSNSEYSGTVLQQVKVEKGVQEWRVPITATFRVEACGASGGNGTSDNKGGKGAKVRGVLQLARGDTLSIVVGQRGSTEDSNKHGSGGGGTFVFRSTNTSVPILVAGGGGGGSHLNGLPGNDQPNGSGEASGSNGNGGFVCPNADLNNSNQDSGSGAGYGQRGGCRIQTKNDKCENSKCEKGGKSLSDNFEGGISTSGHCNGGFGGGGACANSPGGGGGYSGGGVANNRQAGGGGSYVPGHNHTWNATKGGCDEGNGYVTFVIVD